MPAVETATLVRVLQPMGVPDVSGGLYWMSPNIGDMPSKGMSVVPPDSEYSDYKRFGCRIKIHRKSGYGPEPETLLEWSGYRFKAFMRWKWYFRYRAALLQVQNPKRLIEIGEFQFMLKVPLSEKVERKKRELAAQKGEVTKWERIHDQELKNPHDLFGIESHPHYQKALRKLDEKRQKRDRLQKEYDALLEHQKNASPVKETQTPQQ